MVYQRVQLSVIRENSPDLLRHFFYFTLSFRMGLIADKNIKAITDELVCKMASESIMVWHLNRSRFGIRIDHDLASISDHSLASQSITIWHASDH
uniref:Uncharacterized protein n=1 Tax=Escherichia coli TaxID=562 RepID=A0A7U1E211_ECOLX|nr:hypothetical protein [Escherichia coli]